MDCFHVVDTAEWCNERWDACGFLNYGFLTVYVPWSDAGSYGSSHAFLVLILRTCFFPTYSRIVSIVCIFLFSLSLSSTSRFASLHLEQRPA